MDNFFYQYPDVITDANNFSLDIYKKYEFQSLKSDVPGMGLLKHQKIVSRFMNGHTDYDSLLIFHGLGTGKCVLPDSHLSISNNNGQSNTITIKELWASLYNPKLLLKNQDESQWLLIDRILYATSFDTVKRRPCEGVISKMYRQFVHDEPMVKIVCEDEITKQMQTLSMTRKHKVLTIHHTYTTDFNVGDVIVGKHSLLTIRDISTFNYTGYVYDLEVEHHHNYLVENIYTHNTCSSIAISENLHKTQSIRKTLVLTRGGALEKQYVEQLVNVCSQPKNKYKPDNFNQLNTRAQQIRTKKLYSKFYEFNTYIKFSKRINKLRKQSLTNDEFKEKLNVLFNGYLFIVDEAHNIRPNFDKTINVYQSLHNLFHNVDNRRVLLLTGTPIKDSVIEISYLMNLVLPSDNQLPTGKDFVSTFVDANNFDSIKPYFVGRVSYFRTNFEDIKQVYQGQQNLGNLKFFKVVPSYMSDIQSGSYLDALSLDKEKKGIFSNSRQASLMIDTNGNWGPKIKIDEIVKHLKTLKSVGDKLNYIKIYSAKYALIIRYILENPNDNIFIYNTFVKGSGILVLARLLDVFNFSRSTKGVENNKGKRYAVLTNEMTNPVRTMNIINTFNSPKNVHGEYIQVIIGSKITSEGLTFKNVRHVHILTPFWNFTDIEQAIARTIRLFSHQELINQGEKQPDINIYMHSSIPNNKNSSKINELDKGWNSFKTEEEMEDQLEKELDMMMELEASPPNSTLKDLGLDSDTDDEDNSTLKDLGLDSDTDDEDNSMLKDLGLDSDTDDEDNSMLKDLDEEEINKLSQELDDEMDIVDADYENIGQELKNNDYSIDLYMYSVSERKDFLTKKIERLLKEGAFDCFLNMDNNKIENGVDGSRECDYTTCVLKCNSANQNTDGVTFDSYDVLYDDEYKSKIVKCIKEFFSKNSKTSIKNLVEYCGGNVRDYQVKSVLADMMISSTYLTNKMGIKSLVNYIDDDNIDLLYTYSGIDDYYEQNYWIYNENTLKNFIANYLDTKDTMIMKKFQETTDNDEKWSLLQQLTPQHVDDLIKSAITSTNEFSQLRRWILDKFDTSIYHDTFTDFWYIVKNVLSPLKYDGKEWTVLSSSTDEIDDVNKLIRKRFGQPQTLQYYAIFNATTKNLFIRSLDSYAIMRKGKGMECTSFTPGDLLLKIILPAKIVIPGDVKLDDAKVNKKIAKIFTADELEKYTKVQIQTIYNTVSINKNVLCKYIYEWFLENKKLQITF